MWDSDQGFSAFEADALTTMQTRWFEKKDRVGLKEGGMEGEREREREKEGRGGGGLTDKRRHETRGRRMGGGLGWT